MEKVLLSKEKILKEKEFITGLYKGALIRFSKIQMDRLEFILEHEPTIVKRENWEGNMQDFEVFIYEHSSGDIEEYDSKEEYIESVFDKEIKDINYDLKQYQERLLHLEYLLECKCNE